MRSIPVASAAITDVCGLSDTAKRARITAIFDLVRSEKRNVLLSHETSEIFQIIGVAAPQTKLAHSNVEAGKFAEELKFPIVMKIVSP